MTWKDAEGHKKKDWTSLRYCPHCGKNVIFRYYAPAGHSLCPFCHRHNSRKAKSKAELDRAAAQRALNDVISSLVIERKVK